MGEPLRHHVRIACPTAHAFRTFTHAIDAWWPQSHRRFERSVLRMEPGVRGRIIERAHDGQEVVLGVIEHWDPPHALGYGWQPGAPAGAHTRVQIRFLADGDHTDVHVLHEVGDSGLGADWTQRAVVFNAAWPAVLAALASFVHTPPQGDEP